MTRNTRILVVFLAAASFAAGAVFSREPPTFDRSAFAKEELARRRRVDERMEGERIRKSLVDQGTYDVLHYELSLDVDPASESISGTLSMAATSLVEDPVSVVLDLFNAQDAALFV